MPSSRVLLSFLMLACLAVPAAAQAPADDPDRDPNNAQPDFYVATMPTNLRLPKGKFAFRLTHRFLQPLGDGDFSDLAARLFGFDSSSQIGLDLKYGLFRGANVGVYRTSDRTVQVSAQYDAVSQKDAPLGLGVQVNVDGTGNFTDDFGYDIGLARYNYFDDGDDIDYTEYYLGLSYQAFSVKYWYSSDFVNSGDAANYLEANADFPLPNDFTLALHVGRSSGDFWGDDKYTDYSIGVGKTVGNFDLGLKWVDGSDFKPGVDIGNANSSESKVVFTIATTLPWGK